MSIDLYPMQGVHYDTAVDAYQAWIANEEFTSRGTRHTRLSAENEGYREVRLHYRESFFVTLVRAENGEWQYA